MARRSRDAILRVLLNGRFVGDLRRAASGAIDFAYANEWLAWEPAIPVSLSLPLRIQRYQGDPVLAVFENLLPDSLEIRRTVAGRVGAEGADAYSLLAAIGRDCVGALQFVHPDGDPGLVGGLDGDEMGEEEVAALLADLKLAPLGLKPGSGFRISLAGAQEKTALLFYQDRWVAPRGTTATTHILKPQIGRLPSGIDLSRSVENEHLCLALTRAIGLPAAETAIKDFGDQRALVVERFDRVWARDGRLLRRPQEDLCQALSVSPARKYESDGGPGVQEVLTLLRGADRPQEDRLRFMKANVWFWLLGATDGHAKNFSLFLKPEARFELTPLYDIISVQPMVDANQVRHADFQLSMTVGVNRRSRVLRIEPRHFVQSADGGGVGELAMRQVFDELVEAVPKAFEAVAADLPPDFPEALYMSIRAGAEGRLTKVAGFIAGDQVTGAGFEVSEDEVDVAKHAGTERVPELSGTPHHSAES